MWPCVLCPSDLFRLAVMFTQLSESLTALWQLQQVGEQTAQHIAPHSTPNSSLSRTAESGVRSEECGALCVWGGCGLPCVLRCWCVSSKGWTGFFNPY
ncbi:hypothetical protein MHYP_G00048080 [Metynnis hypsauchen]